MNEKNYQMIAFTEDGLSLDVRVDAEKETVWLTQAEMAELFGVDRTRITRHVNSILHDDEVDAESNVRKTHFANADRPTSLYGLDMILAVGYRVNSKRGIAFFKRSARTGIFPNAAVRKAGVPTRTCFAVAAPCQDRPICSNH